MHVLLVANVRGWAWDHKAQNLRLQFRKHGIETSIAYLSDYVEDDWERRAPSLVAIDYTRYDAVVFFSLLMKPLFNETLDYSRAFLGVCSHMNYNGDPNSPEDMVLLNRFRAVFVVNRFLLAKYSPLVRSLQYCPNGVDTSLFRPTSEVGAADRLRVGWVGCPRHKSNKGYEDVVVPLSRMAEFDVAVATDGEGYRPHWDMPSFYNCTDICLCVSEEEGTPNPALEGGACGRVVLTTRVGVMPEIIRHGENGFFIPRSPDLIGQLIKELSLDRAKMRRIAHNLRGEMLRWDWSVTSLNYLAMLRLACGQ